ncbi:unnamed protein product [Parnassius apollo]|uniref:(apollo) hypothetical protein n=1 Tax=Parnassius apollo TaxID=110799 RepID=A0A8S3X375_PARAO|nr:unnamed protein product [Parnassius apollo]
MDAKIWVLLAIAITVQCRDIIVGSINGGHKIFDENKQASPALWRRTENVTITANENETIGGIIVTDLREEKDGDAKIVEGGEGQNNITIELKSPAVLRGFDFHIEAYAVSKNQQKSTEQEIRTIESDKSTENSKAETSLNTDASIPINLAKTQTSSSSESSLESITNKAEKNNQRQNRDTRNIEKITQQTNPVQLFTDTSTTVAPEGIESHTLENKYASTQVSEQRHDFHVPKIQLHEFSRMPESTARNVPISDLKIMEGTNYHREGHREPDQNIYGDNKRYTQVDYPQFDINDNNKTPVPSTVNTEMPTIENKNKNLRKKRDMGHEQHNPIISNKEGLTSSKRFTNDDNTSEINKPNSQTQQHHQDNGQFHKNIDIKERKDQNENDSFKGRYIPDGLKFNVPNLGTHRDASLTDINKLSTSSSQMPAESAKQEDSIYIHQHSQIRNQQSSITNIPKQSTNPSTTKSESISEKQGNLEIDSKVTDSVKPDNSASVSKSIEGNHRDIRDTAMVKTNDKKETSLSPIDNLNDSKNPTTYTTTIATSEKSETDQQKAQNISGSHMILQSNLKIPTVLHFDTDVSVNDGNTPMVSLDTENMERNSRATVNDAKNETLSSTKVLKHTANNNINSNQNKFELTTNLKGIKPGEVTGETTIEPQENIEVPVEFKSGVSDSAHPINLTTDANENCTSTQKGNTDNKDSKSAITLTTEAEKTITYKDEKLQQRLPIIVATDPKTTESRINPKFEMKNIPQQFNTNVSVKENSQSPKIPRDVKETDKVDRDSASIEELKSDMSLKDIKVSSTDSIVTPTGANKEQAKVFENNKNESTEKSR